MTKDEAQMIANAISTVKRTTETITYDVPSALALVTLVIADVVEKVTPNFSYKGFIEGAEYEV
jgi:hypothetical protein